MFFIVEIVSEILAAISPIIGSFAVHHVIFPFALVPSAVSPHVVAYSFDAVFIPFSIIVASIRPDVLAFSLFHTLIVIAFIGASIGPELLSESFLVVIFPVSPVNHSAFFFEDAIPTGFVVNPLALVGCDAVFVNEDALAVCAIFLPFSFVVGSIFPFLESDAGPHAVFPFALVEVVWLVLDGEGRLHSLI